MLRRRSRTVARHVLPPQALPAAAAALLCTAAAPISAQPPDSVPSLHPRPATLSTTVESLTLPNREHLGLVGSGYLVALTPSLSLGPAIYGALTGQRGGLFIVAAELRAHRPLRGPLHAIAGLALGGGGGGAAPVGDGYFVRPSAGLSLRLPPVSLSLTATHAWVGDRIASSQLSLGLSLPATFRSVPTHRMELPVTATSRSGIGFDAFDVVSTIYRPTAATRTTSGAKHAPTLGLVGARAQRAVTPHLSLGVAGAGALAGGIAGYAEYMADVSWQAPLPRLPVLHDRLTVGARAAVGMAGGGSVDVGGGLLTRGTLTGALRWSDAIAVHAEVGTVAAPDGRFRATSTSLGVAWSLDAPHGSPASQRPVRTEWLMGVEQYNARRTDGRVAPLQNIAVRVNRFVSPHYYLSGQARSAFGGGAGAYAVGLLGAGAEWAAGPRWRVGGELLGGAAGGGGVATGNGAVAHAMATAARELGGGVSVRAGVGRVRAWRGGLRAAVVDVSAGYAFGVTNGRRGRAKE